MKILYGMQRPDEGEVRIDGEVRHFRSPTDAIAAGIGMVHQHFMLADNLTVTENIVLGDEPKRRGLIDFREARRRITELGVAYGMEVDPDELVETLGVGERQRVEILKVLYRGARILILDEPTAVLVPQEVAVALPQPPRAQGRGHHDHLHLAQARRGALRRGLDHGDPRGHHDHHPRAGGDHDPPARGADGRERAADPGHPRVDRAGGGRPLGGRAGHLRRRTARSSPTSASRCTRERSLGIAGVEGNGQTELIEALMGLRPIDEGRITLRGEDISLWPTRRRREAGLGYVPEDRQRNGLLLEAPLWENQMLGHQTQRPNARGPWIDRAGARARTARSWPTSTCARRASTSPRTRCPAATSRSCIIGRELMAEPTALVAAHPTREASTSARRRRSGTSCGRRAPRAGHRAADLGRPRGAHRPVRLAARHVPRPASSPGSIPATTTPEELGLHMTGAPKATPSPDQLTASSGCSRPRSCAGRRSRSSSAMLLLASGNSPATCSRSSPYEGFTVRSLLATLNRATPYYLAGVAVAIGFKMNLFNIGVEGQYRLAALVAAAVGAGRRRFRRRSTSRSSWSPRWLVGVGWASIAGVLRADPGRERGDLDDHAQRHRARPHAVPARALLPGAEEERPPTTPRSPRPIPSSGRFPSLNSAIDKIGIDVPQGSSLQSFIFVAVVVGVLYYAPRLADPLRLRPAGVRRQPVRARGQRRRAPAA